MKRDKYDTAPWLEDGERVEQAIRSRGKYNIDGSIVNYMLYGDFVLTNKRVAILTGIFWKKLSTELRPEHLLELSLEDAYKAPGAHWRPVGKKVLMMKVLKDGKKAVFGLAIPADDATMWLDTLRSWSR